jgi:tRNA A-37 threonylcarbamoyl transferase component Bud32
VQPSATKVQTVRILQMGDVTWHVPGHIDDSLRPILSNPEQWLSDSAFVIKQSPAAIVSRIPREAGGAGWILKKFKQRKGAAQLKDLFREGRGLKEMRTSAALENAGIPVARIIAAGESRSNRMLTASYLLTEEFANAQTLNHILVNGAPIPRNLVTAVGLALARFTNAGFVHADLNPGNFLLRSIKTGTEVCLIDLEGVAKSSHVDLPRLAQDFRRFNRRAKAGWVTRLRFLKVYCANVAPALPTRKLAEVILAGQHEWEMRKIGGRRWKVRLHLVNEQARAIMTDPSASFAGNAEGMATASIKAKENNHPGFLLLRTRGKGKIEVGEKTIGFTLHGLMTSRKQEQFHLTLR